MCYGSLVKRCFNSLKMAQMFASLLDSDIQYV